MGKSEKKSGLQFAVMIAAAVIIVVSLGGIIFMLLFGSGVAGNAQSSVTESELQEARILANADNSGEKGAVKVEAMKDDIIVTANGVSAKANTQKEEETDTADGDYIFPDSDTQYLTASEVSSKSKADLRIARNEIMARHGRIFDSADLKEYFESKSWYHGTVSPEDFDKNLDSRLSDVELANIELIKKYE